MVTFEFGVVFRSSEFGVCLRLTIGDVGNGTCEGEVPLSVPTTANLDGSFDSCDRNGRHQSMTDARVPLIRVGGRNTQGHCGRIQSASQSDIAYRSGR